jgi:hypothetical protein
VVFVRSFLVAVTGFRLYFVLSLQSSDARFVAKKKKKRPFNHAITLFTGHCNEQHLMFDAS